MTFIVGNPYESRVTRTIGFVDLSGFTQYTDTHGDEAAVAALAFFRAATREVCARHGVRIAKWLGDGAMLVGVDAQAAAKAMNELRRVIDDGESPMPLRSGIATGPVILFEGDDYIGSIVNLAARLADMAAPGQLLAPKEFVADWPKATAVVALGPRRIRGFVDQIEIVSLGYS